MPSPKLKEYERWKKLNADKNFSLFDYLYHLLKIGNLSTDIWFAIREAFWPEFIEYKEFVLIKALSSQEKVEKLLQQRQQVEFWSNLLTLDPYFEDGEDMEERAELLGRTLVETWKAKLS